MVQGWSITPERVPHSTAPPLAEGTWLDDHSTPSAPHHRLYLGRRTVRVRLL